MAFPTINAQQELNNRKILEDLQLKKQLLQKGVSAVSTIPNLTTTTTNSSITQFMPGNQINPNQTNEIINPTARTAWNQANNQSFGYFVLQQDSIFGNSILPVLPRFDTTASGQQK